MVIRLGGGGGGAGPQVVGEDPRMLAHCEEGGASEEGTPWLHPTLFGTAGGDRWLEGCTCGALLGNTPLGKPEGTRFP